MPKLGPGWGVHYEKFHRTAQAWTVVGVACAVRCENDTVTDCRVALTNMGHVPVRAVAVERRLTGGPLTETTAREAAELAAEGASPPEDLHGSAEYRAHLARVLTRRALLTAART